MLRAMYLYARRISSFDCTAWREAISRLNVADTRDGEQSRCSVSPFIRTTIEPESILTGRVRLVDQPWCALW